MDPFELRHSPLSDRQPECIVIWHAARSRRLLVSIAVSCRCLFADRSAGAASGRARDRDTLLHRVRAVIVPRVHIATHWDRMCLYLLQTTKRTPPEQLEATCRRSVSVLPVQPWRCTTEAARRRHSAAETSPCPYPSTARQPRPPMAASSQARSAGSCAARHLLNRVHTASTRAVSVSTQDCTAQSTRNVGL